VIAALLPFVLGRISPAGERARLSILIFHRVVARTDLLFPETPDAAAFERQMRWVARWFNVLPLTEAVQRLARGDLPARALAITFDDGYADNATVAAPLLRGLGLSATFFVTSGVLDGGRMWNDTVIEAVRAAAPGALDLTAHGLGVHEISDATSRRAAALQLIGAIKRDPASRRAARVAAIAEAAGASLPDDLMMSSAQVRGLIALGMTVGAHTVTHPILSRVDDAEARSEIERGRDNLEQITGERVELFAYPNGVPGIDYEARHVQMVRCCGFAAALSTAHGCAARGADLFQLPRFTPWDSGQTRYGLRLAANLLQRTPAVV
jgi:peptidoglycan/xylan/chitin deacetylase (PgdA/CDA1 family)